MIGNTKKSTCVSTVCHAGKENPPDRRAVVRGGMKRALATPILSTVLAARTYAGDYGCYALERQCVDRRPNHVVRRRHVRRTAAHRPNSPAGRRSLLGASGAHRD